MTKMVAGISVKKFFSYVENKRRYFGKDYLTYEALIVLALNYDVKHNFLAKYVRDHLKVDDYQELNRKIVEFCVKAHADESKLETFEDEAFETCITCEKDLAKTLEKITDLITIDKEEIESGKFEVMSLNHFLYSFVGPFYMKCRRNKELMEFIKGLGFSYKPLIDEFKKALKELPEDDIDDCFLSEELSKFVSIIDGAPEEYNVEYEYMDTQVDMAWIEFQKRKKNKVLFLGEYMSGKKPAIYKMAYQLNNGDAPERFKDYQFVRLDCLDLVKGELDPEYIQLVMEDFYDFIDDKKVIVFLDNFYSIAYDYPPSNAAMQMLLPLLTEDYYVIMTLTKSTTEFLNNNLKVLKQISAIGIAEPKEKEYRVAVRNTVFLLTLYHGVFISDEMVEKVVLYATTFKREETYTFSFVKDVMDSSMVVSARFGHDEVIEDDIKYNFLTLFREYKKYTDENKLNTAIHEAGHFVMRRFCKHFTARIKLISVIPHNDALGYNLLSYDPTRVKSSGYDYYFEDIAFIVAGRAAEELFTGVITDGAGGDLEVASMIAKYMVSDLSLDKTEDGEMNIKANESLQSDSSVNKVDERADKIIKQAYEYAKIVLSRHHDYVLGLAQLLLEKMIVSDHEIEKHEVDGKMEVLVPYLKRGKRTKYVKKEINTKYWKADI